MKNSKLPRAFYTTFMLLGNIAFVFLIGLVLNETNYKWSILWWLIPLIMLIQLGAFARQDRKHEYGK